MKKRDLKERFKLKKESMTKDDLKKVERRLFKKLEDKYILQCFRFPIEPCDFVNDEEKIGGDDHLVVCMKIYPKLKSHYQNILEVKRPKKHYEEPQITLLEYCAKNSVSLSPIDCVRKINETGHGKILRSVYRLLFVEKGKTKKHVVWTYGEPNSGKSNFIRKLRKIFGSDEVDWRGAYLPLKERNRPELKTQIVTCEEFSSNNAFKEDCRHVTKQLFEGSGALIRKGLFQ